jgi:hypothetical protein
LHASVTNLHLDAKVATDGLNVASNGVDLSALEITVLQSRNSVLADFEHVRELYLREPKRFAELAKLIGTNFLEHPPFVIVDSRSIHGARRQHIVERPNHKSFSFIFSM